MSLLESIGYIIGPCTQPTQPAPPQRSGYKTALRLRINIAAVRNSEQRLLAVWR